MVGKRLVFHCAFGGWVFHLASQVVGESGVGLFSLLASTTQAGGTQGWPSLWAGCYITARGRVTPKVAVARPGPGWHNSIKEFGARCKDYSSPTVEQGMGVQIEYSGKSLLSTLGQCINWIISISCITVTCKMCPHCIINPGLGDLGLWTRCF